MSSELNPNDTDASDGYVLLTMKIIASVMN